MDETELLRRFAANAEPRPLSIDVAGDVLATLRRGRPATGVAASLRPMIAATIGCSVVAASLSVVAVQAWSDMQAPLDALLAPFVVTLE